MNVPKEALLNSFHFHAWEGDNRCSMVQYILDDGCSPGASPFLLTLDNDIMCFPEHHDTPNSLTSPLRTDRSPKDPKKKSNEPTGPVLTGPHAERAHRPLGRAAVGLRGAHGT